VEGFGTWPFGEEWLWEAIVGSYVPLLGVLDRDPPLTLSLTPVLCDQLEAPGLFERFESFVRDVRRGTHAQDAAGLRAAGHEQLARELERAWGDYASGLRTLQERGGDLLAELARHVQWTSAATHAVLPLLATRAGLRLQVDAGVRTRCCRCSRPTPAPSSRCAAAWRPTALGSAPGAAASGCRSAPSASGWSRCWSARVCAPRAWR
jgi:1,4-alpha-glucan branching enzyme